MKFFKPSLKGNEQGFSIPTLVSIIVVMAILGGVVLQIVMTNFSNVQNNVRSQRAFNIAEAGINYYLWHLSHNGSDYKDGKTTPATPDPALGYGPYVHNYIDNDGVNQGTYTLWIKPQGAGSTIATIRSIGKVAGTNIIRTVEAQVGAASFANYAVASDGPLWFGNTETADGPIHSNQGVRMDGPNTADVTSARDQYTPPSNLGGDGNDHDGVWCHSSVTTPINCNNRSKADWQFPVPLLDFNQVSGSLCNIKKVAFGANSATQSLVNATNTCTTQAPTSRTSTYIPRRSTTTFSNVRGYLIQLNPNGTYDLYNVNGETDTAATYTSALTLSLVQSGIAIHSSGVIFVEDNVWVRTNPTFSGRVTIASGQLTSTQNETNIIIADDVVYGAKNGTDAIGLVAEDSVFVAPYAPPASGAFTFEVNAAILAQTGDIMYPSGYRSNDDKCTRGWTAANQRMNFYGSVATRQGWTWSWLRGTTACADAVKDPNSNRYISGFLNNTTTYDNYLKYAPPPSYPIATGFNILSWREVLTRP